MYRIQNVILDDEDSKNCKIMQSHYLLIDTNIILDQVIYFEIKYNIFYIMYCYKICVIFNIIYINIILD